MTLVRTLELFLELLFGLDRTERSRRLRDLLVFLAFDLDTFTILFFILLRVHVGI